MKIGIYGDSYGDKHHLGKGLSWAEMLQQYHGLDITNYSVNGSSLYYSFREFERTHKNFDKIIFLVTGGGRITLSLPEEIDKMNPYIKHVTSYEGIRFVVESNFPRNLYLKNAKEAVKSYYEYIFDGQKENLFQSLITKEISSIRPDALLIPCFDNSNLPSFKRTLWDVCKIDFQHYGIDEKIGTSADQRHGHMNQKNHRIFANMLNTWVKTNTFNFDFSKFVVSDEPVEHYFNTELLK